MYDGGGAGVGLNLSKCVVWSSQATAKGWDLMYWCIHMKELKREEEVNVSK